MSNQSPLSNKHFFVNKICISLVVSRQQLKQVDLQKYNKLGILIIRRLYTLKTIMKTQNTIHGFTVLFYVGFCIATSLYWFVLAEYGKRILQLDGMLHFHYKRRKTSSQVSVVDVVIYSIVNNKYLPLDTSFIITYNLFRLVKSISK